MAKKLSIAELTRYYGMYIGALDDYTFLYCPKDIVRKFDNVKFVKKGVYEMLGVSSWCQTIQISDMKKRVIGNFCPSEFKLILRSMDSMNKKEKEEYNMRTFSCPYRCDTPESIKWCIDNKFDIFGLEKMGYATYKKYKHVKYQIHSTKQNSTLVL